MAHDHHAADRLSFERVLMNTTAHRERACESPPRNGAIPCLQRRAGTQHEPWGECRRAQTQPGVHLWRQRTNMEVSLGCDVRCSIMDWGLDVLAVVCYGSLCMTAVIAYGGGVQSTALVVLAATGVIRADRALFSNVGDDSEHPATLRYVAEVATPWAAGHGFTVEMLHRRNRDGSRAETLMERLMRPESRSVPIPVRMSDTGAPGTRSCTADFKIRVIGRWIRENVADPPADLMIGISTDEVERAGRGRDEWYEHRVYPLLDLGLSRDACKQIIRGAGLPVPPKSSCFFCPFHRPATWAEMRRDEPDLFAKSVHLERTLNERRDKLGKDRVYLTRFGRPLDEAIAEAQPALFDVAELDNPTDIGEAGCDEGVCFV